MTYNNSVVLEGFVVPDTITGSIESGSIWFDLLDHDRRSIHSVNVHGKNVIDYGNQIVPGVNIRIIGSLGTDFLTTSKGCFVRYSFINAEYIICGKNYPESRIRNIMKKYHSRFFKIES